VLSLIGIVDDYESTPSGIGSLVRSAGYRTAVFKSAEAFLDGDQDHKVGCLLLDLDKPHLGSPELQRLLARMNVTIPIIFITAQVDVLGARTLKDGAGAVLEKPFTADALLDAIRSALEFPGHSSRKK
jgi:FixJ family two-component response regulator